MWKLSWEIGEKMWAPEFQNLFQKLDRNEHAMSGEKSFSKYTWLFEIGDILGHVLSDAISKYKQINLG